MTTKEFKVQYALGSLLKETKEELTYNARTSKKILSMLSKDKDWFIRYWVAFNSNTPIGILKKLSTDEDWNVRSSVARNPNIPPELKVQITW